MSDTQSVVMEQDYPCPPDRVWRALTEPALIAEWLMKNDFRAEVGHAFTLRGDWGGVLDCQVLAIEPKRRLVYSWNHVHEDPAFALVSTVSFDLTPVPGGTRLRVEQAGFRPGQKQALGGARYGWTNFLAALGRVVAAEPAGAGAAAGAAAKANGGAA